MEYFDFEDASRARLNSDADPFAQTFPEIKEAEAQIPPCFEDTLLEDIQNCPLNPIVPAELDQTKRLRVNNTYVEVERHPDDFDGAFPMFRAKTPCDLCRRMGLDCFIAQRGALINGCTCCISLYRECSFTFTQRQEQGCFLDILSKVTEDAQECEGAIVTKRTLKSLSGAGGFDESRLRKTGSRLSREAVKILKNWLQEHADHPYPSDVEKDRLKDITCLKRSQISNWLANARRRGKVRSASHGASPVIVGAIDIPQPCNTGLDLQNMSPLERWKHSPPENEAASAIAIARAVADAPFSTGQDSSQTSLHGSRQGSRRTSSNDSSYSIFQAPSVSSLETSRSSASGLSLTSGMSHRSRGSFGSVDQKERRRRRRAPIIQRRASEKPRGSRIFQCTFCADSFPSKYDWQRHEKSLHLALERWVCSPNGGVVQVAGQAVCIFCRMPDPTNEHLETHNFIACQEKTLIERTFYRKDHVRQHLKLLHGAKFDPLMESWKSMMSDIKSACGFCPSVFSTWEQRADHLAAHFKNGADMSGWSCGWGFEPHIERLVENSIPPYMNANERSSMDPFVAKTTTPSSAEGTNLTFGTSAICSTVLADTNCWRRLEQVLSEYIVQQKAMGHIPADKELQDQGRLIVFDDDDPWNQTAADNERWLATLKFQHSIGEDPDPMPRKLEEVPIMPPYAIQGGLKHGRGIGCPGERKIAHSAPGSCADLAASAPAAFDPLLDLDFDQLKFDSMDMTMVSGVDEMPVMDVFDGNKQGPQIGNASAHAIWELLPPGPDGVDIQNEPLMSEHDLKQLSGYMANFH